MVPRYRRIVLFHIVEEERYELNQQITLKSKTKISFLVAFCLVILVALGNIKLFLRHSKLYRFVLENENGQMTGEQGNKSK